MATKTKEIKREKLTTKGHRVYSLSGRFLFSMPLTERQLEILDKEDKTSEESYLSYIERTKHEKEIEERKREIFAKELVSAYNEKYHSETKVSG